MTIGQVCGSFEDVAIFMASVPHRQYASFSLK